jgi:DNA-binding NarL/FixJ family response regulator
MTSQPSEKGQIRLMIVGPTLFRQSLMALLDAEPELMIVNAVPVTKAVSVAVEASPQVVVMDIPPDDEGEIRVLRALARLRPSPRVVLVCGHCSPKRIRTCIDAGAEGCLTVDAGSAQLLDAIDAVRQGRQYLGPWAATLLHDGEATPRLRARK